MTGTINFANGLIADEELRLLETKHAILEKLRVRFGGNFTRSAEDGPSILNEQADPRHTPSLINK